jgi:DNA polymerase-1
MSPNVNPHERTGRLADPAHTLYLIDISSFIFRAYYAIRPLHTKAKEPVNAVYGVAQMLSRLADEARPEYLAVVYDSKEPSFRKEIYAEYKANRTAPPDDLIPQFGRIEQLIQSFEMHSYRQSGVEADDLIATLTRRWYKLSSKNKVVIVSSDKDLMQLVNDRVSIWDTMKNVMYGEAEVEEKFGVRPNQIRDYLALVGDSSDNIPGVPSIGPKSAVDLLKAHQTLDGVLKAAVDGKISGKKGEVLVKHEEDARLSAELATVHEELTIEVVPEKLKYHFHVTESCAKLLTELDFHSLLARWTMENKSFLSAPHHDDSHAPPFMDQDPAAQQEMSSAADLSLTVSAAQFHTVNTKESFADLLKQIEKKKEFGFDIETTSLNPRQAELVGIAICVDSSESHYIPVGHRGTEVPQLEAKFVLEKLKPYLEDARYKKIGQNLKYDWSVLMQMGIEPDGIGADTMVAAYVLDPEGRHNLETLAAHYLNYTVTTYEQVCGKGKDQLCFDQVPIDQATRYSAEDAWVAVKLWEQLEPRLKQEKLMEVFATVDLPLVSVLARMESQGVCIDVDYLKTLSKEFEKDLHAIEKKISAYTKGPINLNSPKQLGQLLFEELNLPVQGKTKTGYSTDAQVLGVLADLHEVPKLLLEFREISKLKGTYVDPLPLMRDAKTGKIHAGFHQTVAATGRLSSSDPNLQNIPIRSERGLKIRRAFVPCPGNRLVSADYSQIELRLLAHMSGDPELVSSFKKDEDVHRRTASEIFRVAPDQVSDRQRSIAKAINFGLMYGKTAFGLSQELKIPRKEAADIIQRYFERYAAVKKFLDGQIEEAREKGYVCTLMGRKRYLPDIGARNHAIRANAERMAMNTPIQGTAADLMKIAMTEIDHELTRKKMESKLIVQVHDEVLLDCPPDEVDQARKLITDVMESAMKLDVPLRVNSSAGKSWMDL